MMTIPGENKELHRLWKGWQTFVDRILWTQLKEETTKGFSLGLQCSSLYLEDSGQRTFQLNVLTFTQHHH